MVLVGGNKASCQCTKEDFNGVLKCYPKEFRTKIQRGYWIGLYSYKNETKVVAGRTPYFRFNSTSHLFNRVRSENICTEINRKGTLCGECIDHHGPSIHTLKCIRCHADYMWALYLLSQYFPVF